MIQSFKSFSLCFAGLMLVIFISACKDPDNVGLNVLPVSDLSSLNTTDTFSLSTSVIKEDSLLATNNTVNMLGEINDNFFGKVNASFYVQVLLSVANVNFGISPQLDSIVLSLDYAGYYGDTTSTHNFAVYELDESIFKDSLYYSNKTFATKPTPLGTLTTSEIHPSDSVLLGTVNKNPHLRIRLDDAFGNSLLTAPASNYVDNTSFSNFFKGIYVSDVVTSGSGAILYFGPAKAMTKIALYYKNASEDSLEYDFSINGTGRINHFTHDYSTAVFGGNFNDPVFGANLCYIQSMAGVKTKIQIPYLTNLTSNQNIAINKAELIVTVDNTTTLTYAPNTSLFLVGIDSLGKSIFLPDYADSPTNFGGILNSGTYTFVITRYIQQILTGTRKDYGLFLVSPGASVNAYRTVIGGSNNASFKMKLRITNTLLNP